jgi:hypothetical protein
MEDPFRKTVALLRDADALDGIRLGEGELKLDRLRFPETMGVVEYARGLYYKVVPGNQMVFSDYLSCAFDLLGYSPI